VCSTIWSTKKIHQNYNQIMQKSTMKKPGNWLSEAMIFCIGKALRETRDILDVAMEYNETIHGGVFIPSKFPKNICGKK
jgi:hypothetical protein